MAAAAAASAPYGRCELYAAEALLNAVDPAYGANAEPDDDLPSSSVRGPVITLVLYAGHE